MQPRRRSSKLVPNQPNTQTHSNKNDCLAAAVVGGGADALAADLYAGLGVVGRGGAHALLDLASHGQEGLFDVAGVLSRRLEEGDAQAVGEFLQNFTVSDSITLHVE